MTRSELDRIALQTALDVIKKNESRVKKSILESFQDCGDGTTVTAHQAVVASTATCFTLIPEMSAEITAQLLVNLGLVAPEDDA